MSKVTLELVGIYFNREVKIPEGEELRSVQEIMDLAIKQFGNSTEPGGFNYMTDNTSNPMCAIRHYFKGGITRSGKNRHAGIYELKEDRTRLPIVQAWQYYVINDKNERVSATYPGESFNSFIDAKFKFKDNWKIIWRMVTILREPNLPYFLQPS